MKWLFEVMDNYWRLETKSSRIVLTGCASPSSLELNMAQTCLLATGENTFRGLGPPLRLKTWPKVDQHSDGTEL